MKKQINQSTVIKLTKKIPDKKMFRIYYQEDFDAYNIICFIKTQPDRSEDFEVYRQLVNKHHVVCVIQLDKEKEADAFKIIDQHIRYVQKQILAFRLISTDTYLVGVERGAYYVTMYYARYDHRLLRNKDIQKDVAVETIKGIIFINGLFEVIKAKKLQFDFSPLSLPYINEHFPKVLVVQVQKHRYYQKSLMVFNQLNKYCLIYEKVLVNGSRLFSYLNYPKVNRQFLIKKINEFCE